MKALWRWLKVCTYKRVFISFNLNIVSRAEMAHAIVKLERLHVNAVCVGIEDWASVPFRIWDIDRLSEGEFAQLQAEIEKAITQSESAIQAKDVL